MPVPPDDLQGGQFLAGMLPLTLAPSPAQVPHDESHYAGSASNAAGARAAVVNRTHRVVRERAEAMQARRKSARALVVPLAICSALLLMVCYAVWIVVSNNFGFAAMQNSVTSQIGEGAGRWMSGQAMDSGGSVYLLLLWFLPISAVTLAMVLFGRSRGRARDEVTR